MNRAAVRSARTVTPSPKWPAAWSCGSSLYIWRIVSSYSAREASAAGVVHLADSENASSTLHALLMITPDHAAEASGAFWVRGARRCGENQYQSCQRTFWHIPFLSPDSNARPAI